jgi:hypothetical protein
MLVPTRELESMLQDEIDKKERDQKRLRLVKEQERFVH